MISEFNNKEWDFMDIPMRNEQIFILFKKQLLFNKNKVPFYTNLYKSLNESNLNTLKDCIEKVPVITKNDLRNLQSPYDLIPIELQKYPTKIFIHRGTGGTTGNPTSIFFTKNDWKAILGAMMRSVQELKSLKKPLIAFNGYNQGHISGPIFDDTIKALGGVSISRNFGSDDEQALKQLIKHKCNLIIAPPTSTHKGGSIEHFLEVDAKTGLNYITGKNVDAIFCSSTNLTSSIYQELKNLGIKYIYNYYGSTEILPTAISCQQKPLELHILFGHIALFIVNKEQKHVKNGERGIVLASRIGSYNNLNNVIENQGTELLNYEVGDEVEFITEKCTCGRTSPRIKDVKRVKEVKDKFENGCETW